MATSVSSVVSHFPDAENGFTTTTAGSVASGATTVTLNGIGGYTNGQPVVLVIDPTDAAKKQTFTGIVDTAGVQVTSVVWTAGTNQTHALGATVVDYATATHIAMISKGIQVEHAQDGTHKAALITSRTEDTAPDVGADFLLSYDTSATALKKVKPSNLGLTTGWTAGQLPAVSSVTENGNRSADITFASTVASLLTPGMRIRTSRTVAAPTYMGGAFNGTNHYFTKVTPTSTLSTITTDFTIMAWVEPTAYQTGNICGRADATPANGFWLGMNSNGTVRLQIRNGGGGNYRYYDTYQSLPLNKKTHVAVVWNSVATVIYFDGVSVPVAAAVTAGTAPTTAGTGGDFSIGRAGAYNAEYFAGYISGVGIFGTSILSQATIRSYKNQVLSGSETNCIGAWSLNNTGVNQQAAGTNDLTATNSVGYTTRSPYTTDANGVPAGTYDWAIVTKVATTVATVQYPEGCAIPTSGGISTVDYSGVKSPFGFPTQRSRWQVGFISKAQQQQAAAVAGTWYNIGSPQVNIPVGSWKGFATVLAGVNQTAGIAITIGTTFSTANNSESDQLNTVFTQFNSSGATNTDLYSPQTRDLSIDVSTATPYYLNTRTTTGASLTLYQLSATQPLLIQLEPTYL
jgi:hypothetical protein